MQSVGGFFNLGDFEPRPQVLLSLGRSRRWDARRKKPNLITRHRQAAAFSRLSETIAPKPVEQFIFWGVGNGWTLMLQKGRGARGAGARSVGTLLPEGTNDFDYHHSVISDIRYSSMILTMS